MSAARYLLAAALGGSALALALLERGADAPEARRGPIAAVVVGIGPNCGDFDGLPRFGDGYLLPGLYDGYLPIAHPEPAAMVLQPFGVAGLGLDGAIVGGAVSSAEEVRAFFERADDRLPVGSVAGAYRLLAVPEPATYDAIVAEFERRGATLVPHESDGRSWAALWQRTADGWSVVAETVRSEEGALVARTLDPVRPYDGPPRLDGVRDGARRP